MNAEPQEAYGRELSIAQSPEDVDKRLQRAATFVATVRRLPGMRVLAEAIDGGDIGGVAAAAEHVFFRAFAIAGVPILLVEAAVAIRMGFVGLAVMILLTASVTGIAVLLTWRKVVPLRSEAWIHLCASFFLLIGGLLVVLHYGQPEYIVWGSLFIPISYYFLGSRNGLIAIGVFGFIATVIMVNSVAFGLAPVPRPWLREVIISYSAFLVLLGVFQLTRESFESAAVLLARRLESLAESDSLTTLYNRRRLADEIDRRVAEFDRQGTALCLVLVDLDRFKQINDQFGHQVGDEVLVQFAGILRENMRSSDVYGRWGGEEFMLILPGAAPHGAVNVAEKLRTATAAACFVHRAQVTGSFGVASCQPGDTADALIDRADRALYSAKKQGRNRVVQASVDPMPS